MNRRAVLAAALLALTVAAAPVPAATVAEPTATTRQDGGRIVPEARELTRYLPFDDPAGDLDYLGLVAELEAAYPETIEVTPIGELTGLQGAVSYDGHPIPVIEVTDEAATGQKADLFFSMSIHGNERAGVEGSLRWMEDLVAAFAAEAAGGPATVLEADAGDFHAGMTVTEALARARLVFVALNPDGWVAGDETGTYLRGNGHVVAPERPPRLAGADLNRQWPTVGWHNGSSASYHTLAEPEARAGHALLHQHLGVPEGAADLHGELGPSLLAIMFPAGQFDPLELTRQRILAEAVKTAVNERVWPSAQGLVSGAAQPLGPAEFHTAFDAIGYDDSGFLGDHLVQAGALDLDHEYVEARSAGPDDYRPDLVQAQVDTTRALAEATLVATLEMGSIGYAAHLGEAVGYVVDPTVRTDAGATVDPPFGLAQEPYAVSASRYWQDLAGYAETPVIPLEADAVAARSFAGLGTIAVADSTTIVPDGFWSGLAAFAEAGGNVVLTDAAVAGLPELGVVPAGAVERTTDIAGRVVDVDRAHPLLEGITGLIGQLYFEVPLGYPFGVRAAPVWSVDRQAFEAAGGSTAAVAARNGGTAVGTVPLGAGVVTVVGAALPAPSQDFAHTHGLASYALTFAGNAILVNALAHDTVPFPASAATLERLAGASRHATAAAVADATHPHGARTVWVATAGSFPDALAAGPAAAAEGAPILLVDQGTVTAATASAVERLTPDEVVLVGGHGAVSEQVEDELSRSAAVRRLAGAGREATAAAVSAHAFPDGAEVAYVASGSAFADALAAGPVAGADAAPVLLTHQDSLPTATRDELIRLGVSRIVVVGGPAAVSEAVVAELAELAPATRVAGPSRYATAAALAGDGTASTVFLATGDAFADALAGGPAAAAAGAPLLLVGAELPATTADALARLAPTRIVVLGGPAAVSDSVAQQAAAAAATDT